MAFANPLAPLDDDGNYVADDPTTLLDPSTIISFLRRLLPSEGSTATDIADRKEGSGVSHGGQSAKDANTEGGGDEEEEGSNPSHSELKEREEVGCILWDLSTCLEHAEFLVENFAVKVIGSVLAKYAMQPEASRLTEVTVGVLANIACHRKLSQAPSLGDEELIPLVLSVLCRSTDAACLTEFCRLLSALCRQPTKTDQDASQVDLAWVAALYGSLKAQEKILWICENALHRPLLERALELLIVLAVRGPPACVEGSGAAQNSHTPHIWSSWTVRVLTEVCPSWLP
eukprot:scaffold1127_cov361-Prasinococcus_capsulatus_cf.AAC.16